MNRAFLPLALALGLASSSFAQGTTLPDDPSALLGFGLAEALAALGPPTAVSAFRGPEAWQDDVVFEYAEGYSLFMFGDRLWQLRFVGGYAGSVLGVFIGDGADKVVSLLGPPWRGDEANLVFRLPWKGYPVELRAFLAGGRVAEIYVYRSDF